MKRTLVSFLFLSPLALAFWGCGGGGGTSGFIPNSGGSNTSSNNPPGQNNPAESFSGKLMTFPVGVVEQQFWADILSNKARFESEGARISSDGRFIASAPSPASGWTAVLGNQRVLVDVDGTFRFQRPTDGASEGFFRHPSDPSIRYRFTVAQLSQAAGSFLVLPIVYPGSCGMQNADTEEFCAPRLAVARSQILGRLEGINPLSLRPLPRLYHEERQMKAGPLGTEPNPPDRGHPSFTQNFLARCPDVDGILGILPGDDPGTSGDPPIASPIKPVKYFFSTCYDYVTANACLNENTGSDTLRAIQLPADFLAYLNVAPFNLVGTPPLIVDRIPFVGNRKIVHCWQNHKGRNCAQFSIGDVACKLPDETLVKAAGGPLDINFLLSLLAPGQSGSGTVEIQPGESKEIIIHNNGAFGLTKVDRFRNEAHGELTGAALLNNSDGLPEIRHYLPLDWDNQEEIHTVRYVPDITVKYTAAGDAQVNKVDSYSFLVDDRYVVVNFKIVAAPPFLRLLGSSSELTVQDLNAAGSLTTVRAGKTMLEPLNQEPVELLAAPGQALLNDDGTCLYQADDHLSHAKYRTQDGQVVDLHPPVGSTSNFSQGILSLSPQGFVFCKAIRADGKSDIYTFADETQTNATPQFLGAPEAVTGGDVTPLNSTTRDALFANAPAGTAPEGSIFAGLPNVGRLARWDFGTRAWSTQVVEARADFLPAFSTLYVDTSSNSTLRYTRGNHYLVGGPPAGISWFNYFFNVIVQSGPDYIQEQESRIEGAGGSRTVTNTTENIPSDGSGSTHTVVALNDAGEVAGMLRENGRERPVLYPAFGLATDIVPQLPNPPAGGSWRPVKMAGRYMVLQHTDDSGSKYYLWFRGNE